MWGAKVFAGHGTSGINTYLSVPLDQPGGFLPKVKEPEPYTKVNPRPTEEQWKPAVLYDVPRSTQPFESHRLRLTRYDQRWLIGPVLSSASWYVPNPPADS